MTMYADLHAHTTASDGTFTPTELVRAARALGLSHLAVTDHDTTAGVAEARAAALEAGIGLVPGVELSAEGPPGKCHLLGLGIDPDDAGLARTLGALSEARRTRNARIARRLQELGVPLTLEEVAAVAPPGANVGRPHFAQALIAKGVVSTVPEAFARFLAEGAPAYLPKDVLPPADAIRLIHEAGGMCFLAHPGLVRLGPDETLRDRIAALRALGLDGVEVFYPLHTPELVRELGDIARDLGLLVTGGSDFHGATKPDAPLGVVVDGRGVPVERLPSALLK
jgi:predicted metal-dependent phosphoesterase TrpH